MNEVVTTPWQGDWQARLRSKLEAFGFSSLEEFLAHHPGEGYVKLADHLGDANVAAMQIYGEQIRRAAERGDLRSAAKDCLVRILNEYVKRGWGRGKHFPHRIASAYAAWITAIAAHAEGDEQLNRRLKAVFDRLESSGPSEGWLPQNSDDLVIATCFEEAWPRE